MALFPSFHLGACEDDDTTEPQHRPGDGHPPTAGPPAAAAAATAGAGAAAAAGAGAAAGAAVHKVFPGPLRRTGYGLQLAATTSLQAELIDHARDLLNTVLHPPVGWNVIFFVNLYQGMNYLLVVSLM